VLSTAKVATSVAAGGAVTSVLSAEVAALIEGMVSAMWTSRLKIVAAMLLLVGAMNTGIWFLGTSRPAVQGQEPKQHDRDKLLKLEGPVTSALWSPPYAGDTADEVCHQAVAGDLREVQTRVDACGADEALRLLAKRCLAADRDARPADAGIVARDLTEYMASAQERLRRAEVERASAEGRAEESRAKAMAERRARRLTLALAAALLVGAGIATWQAFVANRAKHAAIASAASETTATNEVREKEAEAEAALNLVVSKVFAAARPRGYRGGLGPNVTLRAAVQAALPYVAESFVDQPLVEARLRITLGKSFLYLSDARTAADQFDRARTIYTELLGPQHSHTLAATNNLAISYVGLGRHADAVNLFKEVLDLRRTNLGSDDPETLRTMNNLAQGYSFLGQHADATDLHEKTFKLMKDKLGPKDPDTLKCMSNLAHDYLDVGRLGDAVKLHEASVALHEATFGPDDRDTLLCVTGLATAYAKTGRREVALRLRKDILKRQELSLGPRHADTLDSMNNLANSYGDMGQHVDALALHEKTLALRKEVLEPGHPDLLKSMYNVAICYTLVARHADALKLHEQTLALRKASLSADHPDTLNSMYRVAAGLIKVNRGKEAVPIIDDCLRRATGKIVNPGLIPGLIDLRMRHFETAKDAGGCLETAELCEKLQRTDAGSLYNAACYRAVTARIVRATGPSATSTKLADAEADLAMAWLRQAVAAGYKKVAALKTDTDLDALRDRADFRTLMAGLKSKE
jgi:eukaryotic-like serine/threonine-protein kinase